MGAEKEGAKSEGEKKPEAAPAPTAGGGGGDKKDDAKVISVYKMDMHCEGCAKKIRRTVRHLEGVEAVTTDVESNKLTVTGKVDPSKVKARLEEKTKKKVEILSPLPKKDDAAAGDKKPEEKKPEDKKPEEKKPPKESTVVLKIRTHCDGCISKMKKIILKTDGVDTAAVDAAKDLVTVKGTMDVNAMVLNLKQKLKRSVEVVPPKKEEPKKEGGGGGGGGEKEKEGEKKKGEEKKDGGGEAKPQAKDGGGEKKEDSGKKDAAAAPAAPAAQPASADGGATKLEVSKYEYYPASAPTHWLDGVFGHSYTYSMEPPHHQGYYPVMNNGYGYVQQGYVQQGYVVEPMYNHPMHAPQMFSEENPNACSVM